LSSILSPLQDTTIYYTLIIYTGLSPFMVLHFPVDLILVAIKCRGPTTQTLAVRIFGLANKRCQALTMPCFLRLPRALSKWVCPRTATWPLPQRSPHPPSIVPASHALPRPGSLNPHTPLLQPTPPLDILPDMKCFPLLLFQPQHF
jgi:hypothetical protein